DFDIEGTVVPAYTVYALAVGVLAGTVLRRTLAAISVAAGVFVATRLGVEKLLRPHYLAPLHRTVDGIGPMAPARDWVLSDSLVDAVGRTISTAREDGAIVHAQHAGVDPQSYLTTLGWHRAVTFQPAGRFWTFQAIEAGIFVLLAAVAVLVALRLVRRASA
ncbi:MAG: ABC transporter permease, partial [Gaiellaceae bacterium]